MSGEVQPMENAHRPVVVWLLFVFTLIFLMVLVGGATRLTGSGLSMVEWHPLMGALPPMTMSEWIATFAKYQESPQFQLVNHWMQLHDFKRIFLWEYAHRLLGRLIGVAFFVPWVWLIATKRIQGALIWKTGIAFVLGGAQGLLGWFMVKSGLVDVPEVSHFRLAAHLSLAFFVGGYIVWLVAELTEDQMSESSRGIRRASWALIGLLTLQIVYGAFMAGTKAGLLFSTFPDMFGSMFPRQAFERNGLLENALNNPVFIHAFHRTLAWLLALSVGAYWYFARKHATTSRQAFVVNAIGIITIGQIVLGGLTVVFHVPIGVAVAHQGVGFLMLASLTLAAHGFRRWV